jgi:8-oxo-dGTP pyrophosphatase MutT (NUDIX family)
MADPAGGPGSELVEVIDGHGRVEAVVTRAEMRSGRLRHRCVYLVVVGSDGRLLVHRRSPDKDVWPGRWDVAAGGVLAVDEPWDDAARRELFEELGLLDADIEPLGDAAFDDDDVHTVGRVYRVRSDGPFHFTDGEVTEARFVTPAELVDLRAAAPFCPDSVAVALPLIGW